MSALLCSALATTTRKPIVGSLNKILYSNVAFTAPKNLLSVANDSVLLAKYQRYLSAHILRCFHQKKQITFQKHSSNEGNTIYYRYKAVMDAPKGVFKGNVDRFNGLTVFSEEEFDSCTTFSEKLQRSLIYWQGNNNRSIWFNVKTEHSDWIPHLTKAGFEFHYAKSGFVVLFRWLPEDEPANIPAFAHTMIGVGGLVVNEKNQVLAVSDRHGMIPNSYKLPGGYVEPSEDLVDAVIREVKEETGIDCEFKTLLSFRHSHGSGFGNCSDIYVAFALRALHGNIQRCEREIAKIEWMPFEVFLNHPKVHEGNRHFLRIFLDYEKKGLVFDCEKTVHQILKKEYCLYYLKSKDIHENLLEAYKKEDSKL